MNETPQKPRMIETYRISWSDIAALISEQIKLVLGYKCSLRVWPEDLDFWGVRAQHRTFSVRELNRLLDAVHASEKDPAGGLGGYTQLRNDAWQAFAEIRITGGLGA